MMQLRIGGSVIHIRIPRSVQDVQGTATVVGVVFIFLCMIAIYSATGTGRDALAAVDLRQDLDRIKIARNLDRLKVVEDVEFDPVADGAMDAALGKADDEVELEEADTVTTKEPMAMDSIGDNYEHVLDVLHQILQNQQRPNDKFYNVNITLSDSVSMDRTVEDTRPKACLDSSIKYNIDDLPKMSVVIPFYNEALSMVIRTVHSILNRTPDKLLNEIILVDDASTHQHLDRLYKYVDVLPKTRLRRNTGREGLIVSRMNGAREAMGPVVVFLDAHSEVNVGWAEPLLLELKKHPRSVVQPFVDGIDAHTLDYSTPPVLYKGSFSWDLRYTWLRVQSHISQQAQEYGIPFHSPTLVGCAMAVNMNYFNKIGAFDEDLKVWGGENLELAFRVWMCGGQVTTVICSRVGHVFKNFPYKFDGDKEEIVQKNLMRVADVWMDDYAKYFYSSTRIYEFKKVEFTPSELASLQKRKELRKTMKCSTFDWFMNEIIPEVETPAMDSVYYGEIMSMKSRACFETTADGYLQMTYYCFEHKIIPENYFRIDTHGLLRFKEKCVLINPPNPSLRLGECPTSNFEQYGLWDVQNHGPTWGLITVKRKSDSGVMITWCIAQVTSVVPPVHVGEQMPQIANCDQNNDFQIWSFTYKFDFNDPPKTRT